MIGIVRLSTIRKPVLTLLFLLAACLTACDSVILISHLPYTYTYDMVLGVRTIDNTTYVISQQFTAGIMGTEISHIVHYFVRQDSGNHWQEIPSLPWKEIPSLPWKKITSLPWQATSLPRQVMPQMPEQARYYPRTACRPNEPKTCYRTTGLDQILFTRDGGKQWQVVWKSPGIRQSYLRRYVEYNAPYIYVPPLDTPFDLGIVEKSQGYEVIVALGNQGILVRTVDGSWEKQAVAWIRPFPEYARSFRDIAVAVGLEAILALSIAVFALLCLAIAKIIFPRRRVPLALPFLLFAAMWLPFVLWSIGIVPFYYLSVALAILLSLGSCFLPLRKKKQFQAVLDALRGT